MKKILLLGSGELGKEFVISAKRLGCHVIACDSYAGAPAMQVVDECEIFSMLDEAPLRAAINKHQPDLIVPEIEAIRTEVLLEVEKEGFEVIPSARAANLTMNRDRIRDVAVGLGVRTAKFNYAESSDELLAQAKAIGFPVVIKPVMSSSGKGQSEPKPRPTFKPAGTMPVQACAATERKSLSKSSSTLNLKSLSSPFAKETVKPCFARL